MNILTDIFICLLPIAMMWNVQTTAGRKVQVCVLFGTRILVPATTIPTLATSRPYFSHIRTDSTWYAVLPTILAQISLNLSVLTACIPGLKSILDNLLSGTASARVRGAYSLTSSSDKRNRLTVAPWNAGTGSKPFRSGINMTSKDKPSNSGHKSLPHSSNHSFSVSRGATDAMMPGACHSGSVDAGA